MPTSNLAVWPTILNLIESTDPHRTVLDVGPGWGKAATLLREYLNARPEQLDAVEAWPDYVAEHRLANLYDTIHVGRAQDLDDEVVGGYDLVLMVDVIEHMPKAEALVFLGRCRGWVVICTPVEFFSNGPGLPDTEEHVSHWTSADWEALADRVDVMSDYLGGWIVRLAPL